MCKDAYIITVFLKNALDYLNTSSEPLFDQLIRIDLEFSSHFGKITC